MSKKDDLLKELKQFIMSPNESAWLTPTQQHAIEIGTAPKVVLVLGKRW